MARTRKEPKPQLARRTELPKLPFTMGDRGAFIRKNWVAVARLGKQYIQAMFYSFTFGYVDACAVALDEIGLGHLDKATQFYVDGDHTGLGPTGLAKTHLQWLHNRALEGGATPDAIRLLKTVVKITAKEEKEMAAKAASAKNKVAKKPKDDAAAPVGGGGKAAGKKGGNAEALAKARAARAENAGPDTRKIKLVNKENPYRENSNRASSFNALKGAKTVEDYKTAGGKVKYLSRWESEGRISLG